MPREKWLVKSSVRIAIIGDYDSNRLRQTATTAGLEHAAEKIGVKLEAVWVSTTRISIKTEELLSDFDAYFGAPVLL